jgi:hypothetical protein
VGRPTLECHYRESENVGINIVKKLRDSLAHAIMAKDQICHRDAVVIIHVSGKRRQSPVWHANRDWGHVLKIIGHGEQKDVHQASLCALGGTA